MSTIPETSDPTQSTPQPPQTLPSTTTNQQLPQLHSSPPPEDEAPRFFDEIMKAVEETARRSESLRQHLLDEQQAGQRKMEKRLEELRSQLERAPQPKISQKALEQLEGEARKLVEETKEEAKRKLNSLEILSEELRRRREKIQKKKEKLSMQMRAAEERSEKIGTRKEAIKEAASQQLKANKDAIEERCSYPYHATGDVSSTVNSVAIPPAIPRSINFTTNKASFDSSWRHPTDSWKLPRRSPAPPSLVQKTPSSSLRKPNTSQIARVSVRRRDRRGSHDKPTKRSRVTIAKSYQKISSTHASGDGGAATTSTSWRRLQEDGQGGAAAKRRREGGGCHHPSTSRQQTREYGNGGRRSDVGYQRPTTSRDTYMHSTSRFPQPHRK